MDTAEIIIYSALAGIGFFAALFILLMLIRSFRVICPPNEIVIVSGKRTKLPSGRSVGYRVYFGGGVWRIPLLHKVDRMDTTLTSVVVEVKNAYSRGGIPLIVQAIANVKVSTNPKFVSNAAERFLKMPKGYIIQVAKETLEGHLRGVIATLTPEEVNEDRLKFAEKVRHETGDDFHKLGLDLDVFKIQHVSDETGYLDNLGREQIANVVRDAEIAESDCRREAERLSAEYMANGRVAQENAQQQILKKRNELRQIKADLEAQAKSEEERAEQGAAQARAMAEQQLQKIRSQLEQLRLDADVVIPAEAKKTAAELLAQGRAAPISENGRAQAEVLTALNNTWASAGPAASEIFLLRQLEEVLQPILNSVKNAQVGETAIVDSGDGKAIAAYMAAYPQAVLQILQQLGTATGVDLAAIASGETINGHATAASTVPTRTGEEVR